MANKFKTDKIKNNPKSAKPDERHNMWKITAIIFIILFAVILISALVRLSRFRPPHIEPSDVQVSMMKDIALKDLSQKGEDVANFSVKTSNDIRPINIGQATKKILEVSVFDDTTRHLYIIDVDTGSILLYSKTTSYGLINYSDNGPNPQGNMEWVPGRRT